MHKNIDNKKSFMVCIIFDKITERDIMTSK